MAFFHCRSGSRFLRYHDRVLVHRSGVPLAYQVAVVSSCLVGVKQSDIAIAVATTKKGWQCHVVYLLAHCLRQLSH